MNVLRLSLLTSVVALTACDRSGQGYVPTPIDGFPGIVHLGEVTPIAGEDYDADEANDFWPGLIDGATYHTLGPPPVGSTGGATATFMGTGNVMCVFVDPESITWNAEVASQTKRKSLPWPDNVRDDGDIDIKVGLSAYYTGSPGVEMGNFEQLYEDSLGNEIAIEYNECIMLNRWGQLGSASGRGTPEFCEIDTRLHPDRSYTVVLDTWALPLDDYKLDYGFAVIDLGPNGDSSSGCSDVINQMSAFNSDNASECVLTNETTRDGFSVMESLFCLEAQSLWCDCAADPSAENAECDRLNDIAKINIDLNNGTAKIGDLEGVALEVFEQCGEYDPDAFRETTGDDVDDDG